MAKGYWVSVYPAISDPERLTAYNELARPAVRRTIEVEAAIGYELPA